VDSYPDEEFTGTVVQVRLSPVTLQNVVTYTVIIGVPNPELKLRPGMTATASILIDKREEALRLPAIALRFQPPADLPEHYTQQDEERAGDTTAGTVGEAPIERDKKSGGGGDRAPGERRRRPRDGGGEADTGSGRRDRGSGEMGKRPDTDGDGMRSGSPGGSNRDRMAGMSGGKSRRGGGRRGSSATVWVLGEDQKIRKVRVRTGLSDMRYVEVLGGELEEGDMVVLGAMAGDNPGSRGTTNPFQQQRGGRRMR
jgi:HlyD family secretion protein